MKRVLRNLFAFYEMEAAAAGVLLGHAQEVMKASDRRGGRQVSGNRCPAGEEPTWEEKMDNDIARTEVHLHQWREECDGILELTVG
jgi:hypothetical protein